MKTPEAKSDDGCKDKQNASSTSTIATPHSGIQNDKDYLIEHVAPEMIPGVCFPVLKRQNDKDYLIEQVAPAMMPGIRFPVLKKTSSSSNDRLVRKWRLKVRSRSIESTGGAAKAPPETPVACMHVLNPPMIPKRKSIVLPMPPPNLMEISLGSSLGGEISLKPRPTVLFLSPRKRKRTVENGSRKSPAA